MWIYLLIGLLFLILALEGYFKGGVNSVITLVGVIIAINFGASFGGLAFGWLADKWPVGVFPFWHRAVPTVAGFVTLVLLFAIAGFVVSILIRKRLADRWDEFQLDSYKGMNRKFGLCTGLLTATVYSVMMIAIIYRLGNFTVPFHKPGSDQGVLAKLNEARVQLDKTPFHKIGAAYDTTPELHYKVRDIITLIWDDRGKNLVELMTAYPGFYASAEGTEFQSLLGIGEDAEEEEEEEEYDPYDEVTSDDVVDAIDDLVSTNSDSLYKMWASPDTLTLEDILSSSVVVEAVNSRYEELMDIEPGSAKEKRLLEFIEDLEKYFETGKSKLYGSDQIVGRWKFAKNLSLLATKRVRTDISVDEMKLILSNMKDMENVLMMAWPRVDGGKIRMYYPSQQEAFNIAADKLKKLYQKAIDDGEVEDESFGYDNAYSNYGEDFDAGGDEQLKELMDAIAKLNKELGKMFKVALELENALKWIEAKSPGWMEDEIEKAKWYAPAEKVAEGEWTGRGFLYKTNLRYARDGNISFGNRNMFRSMYLYDLDIDFDRMFYGAPPLVGYIKRDINIVTDLIPDKANKNNPPLLYFKKGNETYVFTRY